MPTFEPTVRVPVGVYADSILSGGLAFRYPARRSSRSGKKDPGERSMEIGLTHDNDIVQQGLIIIG